MANIKFWMTVVVLIVLGYVAVNIVSILSTSNIVSNKIRFVSLAWQEQSIAANREIVEEWNRLNPDREVEYIQASWNSIYDYLITSFETEGVPDVFHYESSIIVDFASRGYLIDLAPFISDEMKSDIMDVAWASVSRPNGEINGIPFLMDSYIGLYNKDIFERNKIDPPAHENPWSWERVKEVGVQLTQDTDGDGKIDQWGIGMGLRNSANLVMNHSISFGGSFFTKENDKFVVRVGDEEKELLRSIVEMYHDLKCMSPESIGKSGSEIILSFMRGRSAMVIGIGAAFRQQLVENAPEGFHWGVMPPLISKTQNTGISTQTYSIPKKAKKQQDGFDFINFALNSENMAKLALTDWMLPSRKSCLALPQFNELDNGWKLVVNSVDFLTVGSWLGAPGYSEWKGRVANPILQELFAGRLSVEEASKRIEIESNLVLSRYQRTK
ncbi:MAG: sugar ABC transporter substrate-binding protein [Candidatus Marinimicrobia bacterium]|nr:sugar ABC transporter substrate-binding protein [Candidatus Neomarinimicrobiota bacterium]MBL7112885.1 sugar ABC transporter substrate-binding protein [Bacteroidales bacterium]